MADELLDLFANVPGIMDFVSAPAGTTPPTSDGLIANPEHGGVTDEAVQAYISQRYGRVGPAPAVSNQVAPPAPQFLPGQGNHASPPGGMEDGGGAGRGGEEVVPGRIEPQVTPPPSVPARGQDAGGALPGAPPAPTLPETPPPPPLPAEIEFGETRIPRERLEAWIAFQERVNEDPQLQRLLTEYVMGGQSQPQPQQPPPPSPQPYPGYPPIPPYAQPAPPAPAPQPQPFQVPTTPAQAVGQPQFPQPVALPQISPDDLADPAIAALYQTVQAQNAQLSSIAQSQQAMAQQAAAQQQEQAARAQAENQAILSRVSSSFQQQHELTREQMAQIHDVTSRLQVIPSLMRGIDPTTGLPSRPDPMTALERGFEIAMTQIPELSQRREQEIIARHTADQERKRKAGSLSGTGGSSPRTTPAPTSAEGRNRALHDEVAAMFNGTWTPPEGN